MLRD
jgi:hypothetical protein